MHGESFSKSHRYLMVTKLRAIMKPESSLPFSQEHTTGPYSESYESNQNFGILNLIFSHQRLDVPTSN